jgi:hypothetical protein
MEVRDMAELKCPHCGQAFTVDDTELSSIVQQIRDKEFEKDLNQRTTELQQHLQEKHALELASLEDKVVLKTKEQYEKELQDKAKELDKLKEEKSQEIDRLKEEKASEIDRIKEEKAAEIDRLKEEKAAETERLKELLRQEQEKTSKLSLEIKSVDEQKKLAVMEAVKEVEEAGRTRETALNDKYHARETELNDKYHTMESQLNDKYHAMETELTGKIHHMETQLSEKTHDLEAQLIQEKENSKILLAEKEKEVEFYKDLKTRMSTKMVGETLEQHCEIQFNQLRATAFRNAYFEKDNDAKSGSKGDYIYRECDDNGVEIISIMFEMKNEMDETATKHKNEDFFKELDKDRREKNCEYAVLVSLLESDSELYNAGIVDVSYKYDKMYVVRPQCFIPMITLLRNAAMNALTYKQELAMVRNQDIDISNFEDSLLKFKDDFGRNYEIAHKHFDSAIEEIDKTIMHLEKVKKELLGSDNQLRIANSKVEDVSVKKLTKNNPTMKAKFDALKED